MSRRGGASVQMRYRLAFMWAPAPLRLRTAVASLLLLGLAGCRPNAAGTEPPAEHHDHDGHDHSAEASHDDHDHGDHDVQSLTDNGSDVDLEPHLVAGKITVFDFHAQWCHPCKDLDRHLAGVMDQHSDVAVRKLDVVDWDSPLAKRYLGNVPELPYVIVYSPKGRRIAEIAGLQLGRLDRAIEKARTR